jgi:hypothetical protein
MRTAAWRPSEQHVRPTWLSRRTLLFALLVFAASVPFWRAVVTDAVNAVEQQIDSEDAALCAKFGFAVGTLEHATCKTDLVNLRHSHEKLLAAASLP